MKKFIFSMVAMLTIFATTISAQNYVGSSKFTDNVSATFQVGSLTTINDNFYSGHTMTAPIFVLGLDKYINPWFGVGVEARTLVGTGKVNVARFNSKTVFDAVNVSGYAKFNIRNMFGYDGTRKTFEPVVYTGLGWNHITAAQSGYKNYMNYRAGVEFNYNLGNEKAWAIVVNPSVVWNDINNGKLDIRNSYFEITAGIVYHFKTSNGTHTFAKARLYDQNEIDALNARINELENRPAKIIEKIVEKPVENTTNTIFGPGGIQKAWIATFPYNSNEITEKGKAELDKIGTNSIVVIDAYASKEPKSNEEYNLGLTYARAQAVKEYLEARGVKVDAANFHGCDDNYGRVAIVTLK